MNEYERIGNVTKRAQLADMSRPTARKYLEAQKAPAELQARHTWRTRPDPLAALGSLALKFMQDWEARLNWLLRHGKARPES